MAKHAKDLTLVLHVGLHKTASTYVQNVLSARRYELLDRAILYPNTGTARGDHVRTRDGAQSGHILFTRPGKRARDLVAELVEEVPAACSTVLLSSEDFTRPGGPPPQQYLELFDGFGAIEVVLVVRRQDLWIESYYKQLVDQYARFEVRTFGDFLAEEGPSLLDFHSRFGGWRELVGPESFHVLSYDDLAGGSAVCRGLLEIAGVEGAVLDEITSFTVPRYDSVRSLDTLGLRLLNTCRFEDRDLRNRTAQAIYAAAPAGDIELLTPGMRAAIRERCAHGNERIETEWCLGPVPGFRFGADVGATPTHHPDGAELVRYLNDVMALCEAARRSSDPGDTAG